MNRKFWAYQAVIIVAALAIGVSIAHLVHPIVGVAAYFLVGFILDAALIHYLTDRRSDQ